MEKHFCPCRDRECPHNPNNPKKENCSCDSCIQKNLSRGEIPSCFWRNIKDDLSDVSDFSFESFARLVIGSRTTKDKGL